MRVPGYVSEISPLTEQSKTVRISKCMSAMHLIPEVWKENYKLKHTCSAYLFYVY